MNNTINSTNGLNFGAKLDITKVKGSKQRWNNIAKIFADNTPNNNNTVALSGSFKKGLIASFRPHKNIIVDTFIKPESTKVLKNQKDSTIAKVFDNLLNFEFNSTIDSSVLK